jgi:trehalose 6-phosphate phosphatase
VSDRPSAIQALAASPAKSALVLDFDGVLAPIIADAEASAMPERAAIALSRLAPSLGVVAVISGRPADFLAERVRIAGIRLLGSYGIEQIEDGVRRLDPVARPWLGPVLDATRELDERFGNAPGIRVEHKSVSVAVHWRQAPDQRSAASQVERATASVAERTGLRLEPGKLVAELRPPVDIDKGSAIRALLAATRPAVAAYAGDDLGDIPALRAVHEADGYAIVVDHGEETDPRLLALADETYAGTNAFADWLTSLADAVSPRHGR